MKVQAEERAQLPVGLAVAALVVFGALVALPVLPDSAGLLASAGLQGATLLVAAVFLYRASMGSSGSLRRARLLLAIGLGLAAVGVWLSVLVPLTTGALPTSLSLADLPFAAAVPVIIAGLLSYPSAPELAGSKMRVLLDGAIAATSIWIVIYTLVLLPSTQATGAISTSELLIVAFPAADILLVGMMAAVLLRVAGNYRRELSLLGMSVLVLTVFELIRSVLIARASFELHSWPSVVAEAGLLLAALGGYAAHSQTRVARAAADRPMLGESLTKNNWSPLLSFLPFITVGVALLVALIGVYLGNVMTAVVFDSGVLLIMLLLAQQLTSNRELASLNADLRKTSALFESLVVGSSDLITLHEPDGRMRYASPAVFRLLNLPPEEVIGRPLSFVIHPDDVPMLRAAHKQLLTAPGATAQLDLRIGAHEFTDDEAPVDSLPAPKWRWVEAVAHNMLEDPSVRGIVCNTRDIQEQKLLRHRLSYEAYHDTLTGLGNLALARRIFAEQCYGPTRSPVTLLLADLDGFKAINDTFGHAFGDDVLVAVARRLRLSVADEDQVARIGGDEFVFILDSENDAIATANQILESIRRPFLVQGTTVNIAASIGVARSIDAVDSVELLRNADLAMYSAKSSGGSRAVTYDPAMHEETAYRLRIQDGLRRALEDSSFELHYQPIVSLSTGEVVGAEALLRWEDTKLGKMFPDVFIPIAEGSGISAQIDEWVVQEACTQIRTWWDSGVMIKQVSVNISRRQLTGGLPEIICRALADNQIPAEALCVEVTESAVVSDAELARESLDEIRRIGVSVALDDFGTGESSLSQLSTLPVDRVKIDKSFVMPSSTDADALRLLESIVGVCRTMGMPIVAEGVEDETAVANLAAMGVELAQGYYFSRAVPASEFQTCGAVKVPAQRNTQDADATGGDESGESDESRNVIYTKFA